MRKGYVLSVIQRLKSDTHFQCTGLGGVSSFVFGITNERHDASGSTAREVRFMNNVQQVEHEGHGHGHGHRFIIIVNGREKVITEQELSFAQVVALSGLPSTPTTVFTVTYRRGEGHKPDGTLVEGETVKIKDGMIFNVTATDKS
jgi:hypothetical protein